MTRALTPCMLLLALSAGLAARAHAQAEPSPARDAALEQLPPGSAAEPAPAPPAPQPFPVQAQAAQPEPVQLAAPPVVTPHVPPALLRVQGHAEREEKKKEGDDEAAQLVLRPEARVMTGFELTRERPSAQQGGADETDYGFFLRQARVGLEAEIDLLTIDVSVELADAIRPSTSTSSFNKPPYLRNAFINLKLDKAFRVRAGRFKRPFSRLELTSSGALPIRGRGLANDLIVDDGQWGDRALGVMLWGRLPGKLSWHASLSNPTWAPDSDLESNGLDALARLEWQPIDALELGLSGGHKLEVRSGDEINGNAISADVRVRAGKLDFVLDAMAGQLVTLSAATANAEIPLALGLASYATYDIELTEQVALQPTLFGEFADADADFSDSEAVRVVVGLNVLAGEHVRVMPQVELVRPLGDASALNPWIAGESYYVMLHAQL